MAWRRVRSWRRRCAGRSHALEPPTWEDVAAALVDPEAGLCSRSARFTAADVVEHICAISGGRLGVDEVVALADRFLASDAVVRLTPDADEGRRRPAQWSTAAHRALEDRTLALMGAARWSSGPWLSKAPPWERRWRPSRGSGRTRSRR